MSNTYYKTCPNCGANLDPEEKCDCFGVVKESYIISFDLNDIGGDLSIVNIFKLNTKDGQYYHTGVLYGEQADELYGNLGVFKTPGAVVLSNNSEPINYLIPEEELIKFWRNE